METWKIIVFVFASVALAGVSPRSLLRPGSHGFYRFFAWECMLALLLLNVTYWFRDWLAWHQIMSWVLLIASILPLWLGVRALSSQGKPAAGARDEPDLLGFERTTQLVTQGIYKYIRHPLYSSLFGLDWGIFLKRPSWAGLVLAVLASLLLVLTARSDEAECIQAFGPEYRNYMQRTRMFIPYVF